MNYQTIFDSIKADFDQEDVENWSDEEGEDNGDTDELMEWCKEVRSHR